MGPAQISGGAENERRTAAEILPSSETEAEGPQVPVEMRSSARYSESIFDMEGSSEISEESPCAYSPAIIFPSFVQVSQLAEAWRSGVRFCGFPPVAGIRKMLPPTEPKSLIRPSMKAMDFPSGDHAGKL